jgi:hypothetical protein
MPRKQILCPVCRKRLNESEGNVRIEGGSILSWCKRCKLPIEIYDNCKTRVAEKSA